MKKENDNNNLDIDSKKNNDDYFENEQSDLAKDNIDGLKKLLDEYSSNIAMEKQQLEKEQEQVINNEDEENSKELDIKLKQSIEENLSTHANSNTNKKSDDFILELDEEALDIKDINKKQKVRKKKRKGFKALSFMMKLVIILSIIGIAVALALGILFSISEILGDNRESGEVIFEVPSGATIDEIAKKLNDEGIIQSDFLFKMYFKLMKYENNLQLGIHELEKNMGYGEILSELSKATKSNETINVTFPEGFTLYKMAKRLEAKEICSADEFLRAFNEIDYKTDVEKEIKSDKLKYFKKEGFAFPDTYTFFKGEPAANVASKILNNFNNKITAEMYARMNELNMSLEETIIIASIVQSEAGESDEMKKVASVYLNRLNNSGVFPNLQADPTKGYARELKSIMDIANEDILSAYNTYEGKGLPPGAICNPGMDAIMATLYPEDTPYYFFCTDLKTRKFYYAITLKEHEDNLWRAGLV